MTTRKQQLIEECGKLDVSTHIDDPTEAASGFYSKIRGVASEAELERRLVAKKAILQSARANYIATFALIISLISLGCSFYLNL